MLRRDRAYTLTFLAPALLQRGGGFHKGIIPLGHLWPVWLSSITAQAACPSFKEKLKEGGIREEMVSTCGRGLNPMSTCGGGKRGDRTTEFAAIAGDTVCTGSSAGQGNWKNWSDLFHQPKDKGVQHFPSAENYDLSKTLVKPWGKIQVLNVKHPEFHRQRITFSNAIHWIWTETFNCLLSSTRDASAILESSIIECTSVRVTHQIWIITTAI